MKKLFTKIFIICLIALILYIPVNSLYLNSDFFAENFVEASRFENIPYDLQIVNIGTSHGLQGFNYSELNNIKAYNLANKDQMFRYDLQFLKQYKNHLAPEATIFIPVSYMSFTNPNQSHAERAKMRNYQILKPKYILDFDFSDWFLYKLFPVLTADWQLMFIFKDYPPSINKSTRTLSMKSTMDIDRLITSNQEHYFGNYDYNPKSLDYLNQLVEFCLDNNYNPILVGVPVTDRYTESCPQYILDIYYKNTALITEKYAIEFLDYTSSDLFNSNYDYFIDTSHMQSDGAKLFTNTILRETGFVD